MATKYVTLAAGGLAYALSYDEPDGFVSYADDFDNYSVGGLPAGWSEWHNTGTNLWAISDRSTSDPASPSSPNVISSNLQRYCRAWPSSRGSDTDTEISVTLQRASVNFATGVFFRMTGQEGSTPSGYIASSSRNGGVVLYRLDSNTPTTLATVNSATYLSAGWTSKITVRALGDNIRVQQYAIDGATAGKYLAADGTWSSTQQWAINVTDATYSSGVCGITKHNADTSVDYFDDFAIESAAGDATPPVVSLTSPANGATISGTSTVAVSASDSGGIQKVEFLVDGTVRGIDYAAPYTYGLNTESLTNGSHTVAAQAYDMAGNIGYSSLVTVTVSNMNTVTRPAISNAQGHLRLMSLAYSGTPLSEAADTDVADYVDVCATNSALMSTIRPLNPNTHHLLYTNIHSTYLNTVMSWCAYADEQGIAREKAFYHASASAALSGNSNSTTPACAFWQLFTGSSGSWTAHQTQASRWLDTTVTFSSTVGNATYFGYPEKFREINLGSITQAASGGWTVTLEYADAVDGSGVVTHWSPLSATNGTASFTQNGQIYWDPPADWVPAIVTSQPEGVGGSTYRYYYVRARVTVTGTAPAFASARSRDFTGQSLTNTGTIPAYDYAADSDEDGYLSDSEYATRASGKDARAEFESRIPTVYGAWRNAMRVGDSDFVTWAVADHADMVTGTDYNGLFMDNSMGRAGLQASSVESYSDATYAAEYGAACRSIWNALPDHPTMGQRWVLMNTAGALLSTTSEPIITRCPAWWLEFILRPHATGWSNYDSLISDMATLQGFTSPEPIGCYDSNLTSTTPGDQELHDLLCCYYQLSTPGSYLCVNGGNIPAGNWRYKWTDSYAFDVGQPTAAAEVWATGTDPNDATRTYKVYRRVFDNAVVLFKALSSTGASSDRGALGAATATNHALGGTYKVVGTDGTLSSNVTSIDLENGEGAILVPQ